MICQSRTSELIMASKLNDFYKKKNANFTKLPIYVASFTDQILPISLTRNDVIWYLLIIPYHQL